MVVTFCGHGDTQSDPAIREWLSETITEQIKQGANLFYLGGYGGFDRIAASTVWALKEEYPQILSVLVLPYLDWKVDTSLYDETTYPPLETVPRRYAISRRNQWMVDQADTVIACVNHDWGGAAVTLAYAMRKKKAIINYYDSFSLGN